MSRKRGSAVSGISDIQSNSRFLERGKIMNYLDIKGKEDQLIVAKVLVANGYTVRLAVVKDGSKNKTVVAYEKQIKGEKV